jgi:hypothetical protein
MGALREAIAAAVEAHGAGKILPEEMPVDLKTNTSVKRYAHSFSVSATESVTHPYTVEALAQFLGFVKTGSATPTNNFVAAFGAAELIYEKHLKESDVKGLSGERLIELLNC